MWLHRDGSPCERPVTVLNAATAEYDYRAKCSRCGGAGGSDQWKFTGWKCFDCGGSGNGDIRTVKVYTAEKLAKLQAAESKRDAKKQAAAAVVRDAQAKELAAWRTANAEALAKIELGIRDPFVNEMHEKAEHWPLTDNQLAAALKAVDRIREREAQIEAAADCPSGRIHIEGEVLAMRRDETQFGPVTKVLVKHDSGYKLWGTKPSGLRLDKGDRVAFTATVTKSDTDRSFGFFARALSAINLTAFEPCLRGEHPLIEYERDLRVDYCYQCGEVIEEHAKTESQQEVVHV